VAHHLDRARRIPHRGRPDMPKPTISRQGRLHRGAGGLAISSVGYPRAVPERRTGRPPGFLGDEHPAYANWGGAGGGYQPGGDPDRGQRLQQVAGATNRQVVRAGHQRCMDRGLRAAPHREPWGRPPSRRARPAPQHRPNSGRDRPQPEPHLADPLVLGDLWRRRPDVDHLTGADEPTPSTHQRQRHRTNSYPGSRITAETDNDVGKSS
jgi:hypothetical protein